MAIKQAIRVWCENTECKNLNYSLTFWYVEAPKPNLCEICQNEITGFDVIDEIEVADEILPEPIPEVLPDNIPAEIVGE